MSSMNLRNTTATAYPVRIPSSSQSTKRNSDPEKKATALLKKFYNDTWQRSKEEFLMCLKTNMMLGSVRTRHVKMQLEILKSGCQLDQVDKDKGDSLLHLWANFHRDEDIMRRILELMPGMLHCEREGDYKGENVLHVLVHKQSLCGVRALLEYCSNNRKLKKDIPALLNGKAVGPSFACTVMMGQLPLFVAALTFNLDMVNLLMENGAKLHEVNTKGDTVFHSLIRFAHQYPEKETDVKNMMGEINGLLQSNDEATCSKQVDPRTVWLLENKKGLTALKMSAQFALPSLFKLILELQGVYCHLDSKDGLLDFLLYDVTEIDPVVQQHLSSSPKKANKVEPEVNPESFYPNELKNETKSLSVLEMICEIEPADKAFEILKNDVIRSIVRAKWLHYRMWFFSWLVLHILFMSLLSMHAIFKAELIRREEESSSNGTDGSAAPFSLETAELSRVVMAMSVMMSVPSLTILVLEMARIKWWKYLQCSHNRMSCDLPEVSINMTSLGVNGMYHPQLVIFALSVLIDSIWYWISGPDNNFCLTLALLMGWWFCRFFLRPLRKFSFFTVMLQEVLLGDLMRFAVIVSLDLLAFSVAMYITFLMTPGGPPSEEFGDLGKTIMTMFKLMFGLSEIEVLGEASHPWLSTSIFVLFILLTYLLMLNALIAMMSNTCSSVAHDRDAQWKLQRLSLVLFMESLIPCQCWLYKTGKPVTITRYDLVEKLRIQEDRYFIKVEQARFTKDTQGQHGMPEASVVDLRVAMMLQMMKGSKHLPAVMDIARFKQATDLLATATFSGKEKKETKTPMEDTDPVATTDGARKEKKTPMKEGEVYTYTSLRKHLLDQIEKDGPYRKSTASTTLVIDRSKQTLGGDSGSLMLPASARAFKQETDRSSGGPLRRWKSEPMLQVYYIPSPP